MVAEIRENGLTFGDVLIIPKYSEIESRTTIDVSSSYLGFPRRLPIISAPMDYVTGIKMAKRMHELNAYGIVNRFTEEDKGYFPFYDFGVSVGVKNWEESRDRIYNWTNAHSVCIDVAHGDHKNVIDMIKQWKKYGPTLYIIAGNVATVEGFKRLADAGANAIRVGIGPGSACSTRENTGVGVPQLTAIMNCAQAKLQYPSVSLIADGGIQTPGDIAKALAAGADAVMLGQMLAGHDESPGELVDWAGHKSKRYRGQSLLGSNGERNAPEGVEGFVEYKGPVEGTINSLMNYLRSSMSYVGARNLREFRRNAEFIKVSPATFDENRTRL